MRKNRRGMIGRAGAILAVLALVAAACGGDDGSSDTVAAALSAANAASADAGVALTEAQSAAAGAGAAQAAAEAAQRAAELAQATASGNQEAVEAAEVALADAQAAADAARSEAAAAQDEARAARTAADEAVAAAPMFDEPPEMITVEVWSWNNEGAYPIVHEQAEKRFEEDCPNVDIVRTYTPFADYMTNLRAAIAAGEPPDVAQVPWTGEYTDLVNSGQIMSLEGHITERFPAVFDPIAAIASVDGEPFAVPLDVNSLQIAYNKAIFAELGLEVPRSAADLKAVAAALDDAGYFGVAVGTNDQWAGGDLFFAQLAYTDPTNTLIVQADAGNASWDDPQFLQAAENLADLVDAEVFAPGANSMVSFVGALELFVAQQAAMFYPVGNFITGGIAAQVEDIFKWGLFPFPSPTGGEGFATGGVAEMFSVPAGAEYPDMGVEFLRYLTDAESEASLVANDFIPSWGIDLPADVSDLYRDLIAAQATVRNRTIYTTPVYTALLNAVQGVLSGSTSPAELVAAMADAG